MSVAHAETAGALRVSPTRAARGRAKPALALFLVVAAVGVSAYVATNVSASLAQRDLRERWARSLDAASADPAGLATRTAIPGEPVARLVIPAVKLDLIVVEGGAGHRGPAHMPSSALPGSFGVSVLEAGRFGFGNFFLPLEQLRVGDEIIVESLTGATRYRVSEVSTIPADRLTLSEDSNDRVIELTAARRFWGGDRLVVRASSRAGGGA
jgi:LPXTG-site transpeptidase (sortase) family protein